VLIRGFSARRFRPQTISKIPRQIGKFPARFSSRFAMRNTGAIVRPSNDRPAGEQRSNDKKLTNDHKTLDC
jgi:hypothetical protein